MKNNYLKTAINAVETSGKILIEYFEKVHDFKQKNENSMGYRKWSRRNSNR